MQPIQKPASKVKVAVLWAILTGNIVFWIAFWLWWNRDRTATTGSAPPLLRAIVMIAFGGFFLAAGVMSYLVVVFSDCFTFNFSRPVWNRLKAKIYFANIFVPLLGALGLGLVLSAFLSPVLSSRGLSPGLANLLPVLGMVAVLQVGQLWVQIWAPLEKRVIARRLLSQGVTAAQLQNAVLVGLSNPLRSSFKKLASVEEDIGALWVGPDQLVYWGDSERFAVRRDQLVQIERKADAGGTTMLYGITHVILHIRLAAGSERQIRLHLEGLWTMGQKRLAMDGLADSIARWHANTVPATAA